MQFIRLPKPIDITETKLPELVADLMSSRSVQNINIISIQKLQVNILLLPVVEGVRKLNAPSAHYN